MAARAAARGRYGRWKTALALCSRRRRPEDSGGNTEVVELATLRENVKRNRAATRGSEACSTEDEWTMLLSNAISGSAAGVATRPDGASTETHQAAGVGRMMRLAQRLRRSKKSLFAWRGGWMVQPRKPRKPLTRANWRCVLLANASPTRPSQRCCIGAPRRWRHFIADWHKSARFGMRRGGGERASAVEAHSGVTLGDTRADLVFLVVALAFS